MLAAQGFPLRVPVDTTGPQNPGAWAGGNSVGRLCQTPCRWAARGAKAMRPTQSCFLFHTRSAGSGAES